MFLDSVLTSFSHWSSMQVLWTIVTNGMVLSKTEQNKGCKLLPPTKGIYFWWEQLYLLSPQRSYFCLEYISLPFNPSINNINCQDCMSGWLCCSWDPQKTKYGNIIITIFMFKILQVSPVLKGWSPSLPLGIKSSSWSGVHVTYCFTCFVFPECCLYASAVFVSSLNLSIGQFFYFTWTLLSNAISPVILYSFTTFLKAVFFF